MNLPIKISIVLSIMLLILSTIFFTGCAPSGGSETDFERTMGYIPQEILERSGGIWYTDVAAIKDLNNAGGITTLDALYDYFTDQPELAKDWSVYDGNIGPSWQRVPLTDYVGFEYIAADRITNPGLSGGFSIIEADFDEDEIIRRINDLGYQKVEHEKYSLYQIELDLSGKFIQLAGLDFSCMAILDNRIVVAYNVQQLTEILDAIAGDAVTITGNQAGRAVSHEIAKVMCAVIYLPEMLFYHNIPFQFDIPDDWGILPQYDMVSMGYRNQGDDSYLDIVIYYDSEQNAEIAGGEIFTRVQSYSFGTLSGGKATLFSDLFEVSDKSIISSDQGAVLKLSFQLLLKGKVGLGRIMGSSGMPADLLFLAPDPSLYVAE